MLNQIEMAFQAYDPCFGCATHYLSGPPPVQVRVFDQDHQLLQEISR